MLWSLGVIIVAFIKISDQAECSHGDIRLVNGTTLQEGRLEVCIYSNWGTVCNDGWGDSDSFVVCRQLGYQENAGRGIYRAYFGQGTGQVVLGNVDCNGEESTLLECDNHNYNCRHNEDVSVRCILREDQRVKNITLDVDVINAPSTGVHTALISWILYNNTADEPNSFDIKCFNKYHSLAMLAGGQNFTTHLLGLLPLTSYNCCVSAVYELYVADGICIEIETPELFVGATTVTMLRASETNVVGGVLGFIIVILFILLIISVLALVYLSQPRWKRNEITARLPESIDHARNSTMDMPVCSNLSYVKAPCPSDLTTKTRGAHPSQAVATQNSNHQLEGGAGADYSSIGPDYENIDSKTQSQRKNQVPAGRLSERYEYSEAHLNESVPEGSANYEVPLNLRQNVSTEDEDYSHLKH